jgi:hypothetical protein
MSTLKISPWLSKAIDLKGSFHDLGRILKVKEEFMA